MSVRLLVDMEHECQGRVVSVLLSKQRFTQTVTIKDVLGFG